MSQSSNLDANKIFQTPHVFYFKLPMSFISNSPCLLFQPHGLKTKGKRELLNLESFVNYGDAKAFVRQGIGKAHMW
jgi:hypothetical protein